MVISKQINRANKDEWWAFSETEGWVLLDKTVAVNRFSDFPEAFQFLRCSDWSSYEQGEQAWNYKEANRYLDSLSNRDRLSASRELFAAQETFYEERHAA